MFLELIDEEIEEKCICNPDGFVILINEENKLQDYLNNPDIFYKAYKDSYFNEIKYTKRSLFNKVINPDFVGLNLDTDIIKYIESNKFLKNKKIVLKGFYSVTDEDRLLSDIDKYKKYINNIYIRLLGDRGYVNILNGLETIQMIKKQALEIKSLNLSPIETVMYTYDIVRSRIYNEEEKGESKNISRDLSEVLRGNKIVCEGYSEIFSSILTYLGFNCKFSGIDHKNGSGHQRNTVYIKDDKYKIDGVYYFDTTWDSKYDEQNNYLNSYRYFAKTKNQMDNLSSNYNIEFEIPIDLYENIKKYLLNYINKEVIDVNEIISLFHNYETNILLNFRVINKLSSKYNGKYIVNDFIDYIKQNIYNDDKIREKCYEFMDEVKNLMMRFHRPISTEKMIRILNSVRKVEHNINPDLYKYDIDTLSSITTRSLWSLNPTKDEINVCSLFGIKPKQGMDKFYDIINYYEIDKDIKNNVKIKK